MSLFGKGRLCQMLSIDYPIIQAGMVWVSGGKLAGHAAKAGVLGVIGAGSMTPELLRQHIKKAQVIAGDKKGALAVNIPLLYKGSAEQIEIACELGINIFITSAGNPKLHTTNLKSRGKIVMHVSASPELAQKCQAAGVDVVIAEGFEAGGHNGRDEITTLALIPQVVDCVSIPVVAAGGIGDGRAIAAAFCLGADGVQMGTRFLATQESSAHDNFKQMVTKTKANDTFLMMKQLTPVRLLKNNFSQQVAQLEERCASAEELALLLGKGRAKRGMHEGDLSEGELEIGQIASMMRDLPTVEQLVQRLALQYQQCINNICSIKP